MNKHEKLADIIAKKAVGFKTDIDEVRQLFYKRHKAVAEAVDEIAKAVAEERDGKFYCRLCNKSYSRPGLYQHLTKKHGWELRERISEVMDLVSLASWLGIDYSFAKELVEKKNGLYSCRLCNKEFALAGVYRHLIVKHGIKRHERRSPLSS